MTNLDIDNLNDIFNTDNGSEEDRDYIYDYVGPHKAFIDNIERANAMLNRIEHEMDRGGFTARLVEVAGQLINSITMTSKEILGDENYKVYLNLRERMVDLKDKEIEIKRGLGNKPTNQNLIISSREDILKLIGEGEKETKIIENNEPKKVEDFSDIIDISADNNGQ